jgi:septal ring factor EnvC (AmiA/AmiB activator)
MMLGGKTHVKRVAVLAACLCLALLGGTVHTGVAQDKQPLDDRVRNQQKELEKIKREIEERRQQSKKLGQKEKAVLKKLSTLDKDIDLSRRLLKNLSQQEALIAERVDSLRARIAHEDSMLVVRKHVLGKRIRQLYKRDPNYRWDILLGSSDIEEALRRYKFSQVIAERDAALIEDIRARKLAFEVESAQYTESLAEIVVVRGEREQETQKLESGKQRRQTMLAQIRSEKSRHAAAIKELEAAQQKVMDLIGQLEKRHLDLGKEGLLSASEFAKLKGRMIRPAEGKIVRGFGKIKHPKYGTVTFNNGVDIGAVPGSPIRAVAPGLVEFVEWIDGYGKCIILNHGSGYYTLYAHVAATYVSQGQRIAHGEVIAEVGNTGSLNGYECHFEIRKSKQALNPLDWFAN